MKKIPIGKSDFKTIRDDNMFFVDKSLFIKEFIDIDSTVCLISRPRLFGKTFNLSMLRYFLENPILTTGEPDNSLDYLFTDLLISQESAEYTSLQGTFPCIWLSFKDINYNTFNEQIRKISKLIQYEYNRHRYLLTSEISEEEKTQFNEILKGTVDVLLLESSIYLLSELLARKFNKTVMVFIDDIDTPIYSGYIFDYYNKVREFMQNFLGNSFKDNVFIQKVLITCTINVLKENSFSGFLNYATFTLTNKVFNTSFGYTETEIATIIEDFEIQSHLPKLREWYSGIILGSNIAFYPWAINNFIASGSNTFGPYWTKDIYDELLKHLIISGSTSIKQGLFDMLGGKSIQQTLDNEFSLPALGITDVSIWSFLVHYGYLKAEFVRYDSNKSVYNLDFPNKEVEYLFIGIIKKWLDETVGEHRILFMLNALQSCIGHDPTKTVHDIGKNPESLDSIEQLFYEFINEISTFYKFKESETGNIVQVLYIAILLYLKDTHKVYRAGTTEYGDFVIYIIPKYWNGVKNDIPLNKLPVPGTDLYDYVQSLQTTSKSYLIGCRMPVYRNETISNASGLIYNRLVQDAYINEFVKLNLLNVVTIGAGVSRYRIEVFGANYGKGLLQQLFKYDNLDSAGKLKTGGH